MRRLPDGVRPEWVRPGQDGEKWYAYLKKYEERFQDVVDFDEIREMHLPVTTLEEVWHEGGLVYEGLLGGLEPEWVDSAPRRPKPRPRVVEPRPKPEPTEVPESRADPRAENPLLRRLHGVICRYGLYPPVTEGGWVHDEDGMLCSFLDYRRYMWDAYGVVP